MAAGRTPYELGHLPGAVSAPYSLWRGPKDNPGKPLDAQALTALLHPMRESRWSAGTEVTLVQRGDRYFAAPRAMAGAMFTMRELREGALFGSASRAVPVPVPAREKKR